ncbi:hypothetical protein [Streptomyces sp. RFCAC02]|uniref:hypothetical protein n=1 Tax=Streptomyces sp. RFCAC02 TaxID=2499143 RepID=UPI00143D0890|nr:hypothetical protein [Streptomyces sp. RFCAC02]
MPTWTPRRSGAAVAAVVAAALSVALPLPAQAADDGEPEAFTISDERIVESSGLQSSGIHPGVYWTHNDSDDTGRVFAVDGSTGETVATVTLAGVEARDVEAISLGPDGDLYVGDIGDNFDGAWSEVYIYRFPEPETLADITVEPEVFTVTYDDGPRDAEALMVHPVTGRVYIASKKREGDAALYAGPEELSADGVNVFERVADLDLWVTDGAFSPDGTRLLLRGYFGAGMYRWTDDGTPEPFDQVVQVPIQQQGESVTFTRDGRTLMFGSEGENSTVEPVRLKGDMLPDSVADEDGDGEGDGSGDDSGSGASGDGDDGGADLSLSGGAVAVVVVAIAAVLGVRRLVSRRR